MRLSNLADYAVVTMSEAARQCGATAVLGGGRTSAATLSLVPVLASKASYNSAKRRMHA